MKASVMALAAIGFTVASIAGSSAGESSGAPKGYKPTGESKSCLRFRSIRSIKAIDETHLLVRVGHNEYYMNHTSGRCANATRSSFRLEVRTPESQLCRAETVDVVDNATGISFGSCVLGKFERLERASS